MNQGIHTIPVGDENEYDIMERDEYVEDIRDAYIKEKRDIQQKIFEEEMNKMQLTKRM